MARKPRPNSRNADTGNGQPQNEAGRNDSEHTGSVEQASAVVDPASISNDSDDSEPSSGSGDGGGTGDSGSGKRRGRRPGSRNKPKEDTLRLGDLAEILRDAHTFLALGLGVPELMLNEDKGESEKLAKALARVADYYDVSRYAKIPTHPLVSLARVAGAVYIPKYIDMRIRKAGERAKDVSPKQGLAAPAPAPAPPPPPKPQAPPVATPQPTAQHTAQPSQQNGAPRQVGAAVMVRAAPIPGFEDAPVLDIRLN